VKGILIALSMLFLLIVSVQAQAPSEIEPNWNLQILTFADLDEDERWDDHERAVKAGGRITYTGVSRTWDGSILPPQIRIPYGVEYAISGRGVKQDVLYKCKEIVRMMPQSGTGIAVLPCQPPSPLEFLWHLWISAVRKL
jgi:hypothetical protein